MLSIKRRQFLQFAGSTLATIGVSQLDIMQLSHRYAQVLAQSTPRKIALLVGINDYPNTSNFPSLQGCVTDVELQRQLLTYRFGFNPKDIYTLMDRQATRQGILAAFEEYLIRQVKPGDVVVFHKNLPAWKPHALVAGEEGGAGYNAYERITLVQLK